MSVVSAGFLRIKPRDLAIDDRRGTYGISLFIATEAAMFVMLFVTYYYLGRGNWLWPGEEPPKLHYAIPMLVILAISSGVLHWGEQRVKQQRKPAAKAAMAFTIFLGLIFVVLSVLEFREHLHTLSPRTEAYGSIFYTIVSIHGVHLILGLLMLLYVLLLPRIEPTERTPHRPYHNAALYWHFVDVVWLFVVVLLYIVPNALYGH